ncbi:MAG: hypothetical protein KGJ80_18125, partial [Chloroflexota bacterium]|nr:hypothetical protein [Chloroflexota bacterium]
MPLFGPPNIEKMKSKGDVMGLIKLLSIPNYKSDLRNSAIDALSQMGVSAFSPLITALFDKDPFISDGAQSVLKKIGTPAVEGLIKSLPFLREEGLRRLEGIDPNWGMSEAARNALPVLID